MKKTKKKILIIENFTHYRNAIETYKLFNSNYDVKILIPKKYLNQISFFKIKNIKSFNFKIYFIYIYLIFKSKKYDYICISTPPEYSGEIKSINNLLSFLIFNLTFLFYSFLFGKKIILQIRNLRAFFPEINNNSILSRIRYYNILFIKRFSFETKLISDKFKNLLKNNKIKNKHSTYIFINHIFDKKQFNVKKPIIGILGTVDTNRKNYNLIIENFSKIKRKVKIIFLGKNVNFKPKKKFKNLNFVIFNKFIPFKKFIHLGKNCKFLISTLKDRKIYGNYKSSGTFGDAIFLKKPMIAPTFSDPKKEFSSFCFYYKNKKNFQKLLKKLVNKKINYSFAKFQAQSNLKRVEKELNL